MDEVEAGRHVKLYNMCNKTGHTYKKYTVGVPSMNPVEVGHFEFGADSIRPRGRWSSASSAHLDRLIL